MAKLEYRGFGVEPVVISKSNFGAYLIYVVVMCAAFFTIYNIGYYSGETNAMTQSIAPLHADQIKYLRQEKERLVQTSRNVSYNLQRVRGLRDETSRALVDHYKAIEYIADQRVAAIEYELEQDAKLKKSLANGSR
ncbi:hypothetical protein VPEG_00042 [Vibrio phage SIO-2]|uniref:hypothetical protein n=1 Tax=Vibrio phage SIO-2 TaxID=700512 RepID=UPI0002357C50|nr:hypothetical protein VPEG_00042 [Vibrio phage SIO-2]AET42193.1 hypothetical protein VPEG_00042 [Vibrio phage SIO-2]